MAFQSRKNTLRGYKNVSRTRTCLPQVVLGHKLEKSVAGICCSWIMSLNPSTQIIPLYSNEQHLFLMKLPLRLLHKYIITARI